VRRCSDARLVGLRGQQEQVVDGVDDVLGLNVFFGAVLAGSGRGAVYANMSDFLHSSGELFVFFGKVVLEHEITTEGENEVLQDVDRSLATEQEHVLLEEASL